MRKLSIAAITAVCAVGALAMIALADDGPNETGWDFGFSKNHPNKATGSDSNIHPAQKQEDGTYKSPSKSVIVFPKGSKVNTNALPACNESPSDVQTGAATCPANTKVGDGLSTSLLGGQEIKGPIEAFNQPNKLLMVVKPCAPNTGPGKPAPCNEIPNATIVLVGDWTKVTKQPTLTVPTPPQLLTGGIVITEFKLKTKKHTKGRGKKLKSYATTPAKCTSKGWTSKAIESYQDGTKLTIPDTQKCKG